MSTELQTDTELPDPLIEAERCIAELQRGRPIIITGDASGVLRTSPVLHILQPMETLTALELEALLTSQACQLVLSRQRALALDLMVDSNAVCLELAPHTPVETVRDWAGLNPGAVNANMAQALTRMGGLQPEQAVTSVTPEKPFVSYTSCAKAALNLASHAHILPAFIMYTTADKSAGLLRVSSEAANAFSDQTGKLFKLSSARIPLASAQSAELTVFRERHGNAEHIAISVGEPDFSNTVTVRLHSSCLTGDILGSMKCDCGEQLQRAISSMAEGAGGVILYVSQEGRGIGLASKLLAYQLQDQGMDTIDANQHLGFEADERRYSAAVSMLDQLGISSIKLMTNNPLKIDALRQHGVNVAGRVPSPATVNAHNARYLATKRERAGHLSSCDTVG